MAHFSNGDSGPHLLQTVHGIIIHDEDQELVLDDDRKTHIELDMN